MYVHSPYTFFRNSCITKRLVVYHPLTNLSFAAVGFLFINHRKIDNHFTYEKVSCLKKAIYPKSASQICYKESNFIFAFVVFCIVLYCNEMNM